MTSPPDDDLPADPRHDCPALRALVERWQACWNGHDMLAASRLVARDADFVTVTGEWLRGRREFLGRHRVLHATQMRSSTWSTHASSARPLSDRLWVVHVEWAIDGDFDADGCARPARRGHFTWVVDAGPPVRIVAAQNTNLGSLISHRLAPARGVAPASAESASR